MGKPFTASERAVREERLARLLGDTLLASLVIAPDDPDVRVRHRPKGPFGAPPK